MNYSSFKVAIPTYRRPELLQRALASLISQTHRDWIATVYDDSPDREGTKVVAAIGDSRIQYAANSRQEGAARNIDLCFGKRMEAAACMAMILEDDNYLLPGFLELAAREMSQSGAWMGLFNQLVHDEKTGLEPASITTRGSWFSSGWVTPLDLHASLLLMEGLSNGGIVWKPDSGERLTVGEDVEYTGLHEACRSLLVRKDFWFCGEAQAVWTRNCPPESARKEEKSRVISRGHQSITRAVYAIHGWPAILRALGWCGDVALRRVLVGNLLHSGLWAAAFKVDALLATKLFLKIAKGIASRALISDPCTAFVRSMPRQTV